MKVIINFLNEELARKYSEWPKIIETTLSKGAECQEIPQEAELGVTLGDDEYLQMLNREYRNIDRPTDVLSFALNEGEEDSSDEEMLLGDIVISVDRVLSQAQEYGHSETRELAYLAIHGLMHIMGYDHEKPEDKKEMRVAEEEVLRALGITREDIHDV
ncbi:MAG: rRNA maturation RNase YbeY [Negativicoccus succinicivorans]|nr:rRNA maturation RNase YbeY [Negativicoccus succinicivorans]